MSTVRNLLLLLGLDFFVVVTVFNTVSSLWLRHALPVESELLVTPLLVPLLLVMFAIYLIDGYKPRTDMMSLDYTSLHLIAIILAMLATLLLTFVFTWPGDYPLQSSRAVIVFSFLILAPVTLSYRRSVHARFDQQRGQRSLVFLGDRASCLAFREECRRIGTKQSVIFSVVSDESVAPFAREGESVQTFSGVINQVQQGELVVEAIVLRESNRELQPNVAQQLVTLYFAGVPTFTLELFHQIYWRKIPLYRLNQTWLFQEGFQIAREPVFERLKRASDIFLSVVGLALASPLILACGFAVWMEDRGPVFFRQSRVGRNRVKFSLLKLRTMRPADEPGAPYTLPGDARVTRIGRFLRNTRIDELPQLWNVLRGEMSLVGPRPIIKDEIRKYGDAYEFYSRVQPGITGLWQISGRNNTTYSERIELDVFYVRNWSVWLDLYILASTVRVVLLQEGAY